MVKPHDPWGWVTGDGVIGGTRGVKGASSGGLYRPTIRRQIQLQLSMVNHLRDVKDGNLDHLTREPEQVRAFRDTWRDGIHSYLGYLRDRLVVARELLTEWIMFVQIGDENVHRPGADG